VVAYPAGGGTDTLARLVAAAASKALGQPIVIVNRAGAAGRIGTTAVARAQADGYTLLLDTGNATLRPAIEPAATAFKPSDFAPVALLTESPVALAVHASLPVQNVSELLAYSRSAPGTINYASTGQGSPQHLVSEMLIRQAGVQWTQVPYQGGAPALQDLNAGRVQVMFSNPVPLMPYVDTHRLKVLAVTSRERLAALPNIPTMVEAGVSEFVIGFWNGVLAPRGTPAAIIQRLSAAFLQAMEQPSVREALTRQGSILVPTGPEQFSRYMTEDSRRWENVARTIDYRPTS
jgi:tripartite-type tricarboxylate transporter receptor subunit TctC